MKNTCSDMIITLHNLKVTEKKKAEAKNQYGNLFSVVFLI